MKSLRKNVFTFSCAALVCVMGLTLLNSCLKQDNSKPQQPKAAISALQASPGSSPLDLYLNGNKIFTGALPYGSRGTFPQEAGTYAISFVNSAGDTILHQQDSIAPGLHYSLIAYDTASARKLMFFQEQFDQAQTNADAYIRFLQLSPDADDATIYIDTTEWFSGRSFADNLQNPSLAKFNTINQGTYSFTAVKTSTGDTLGNLSDVPIIAGQAYTVFLRGLASHTQDTLGLKLDVMRNYGQ